jgi:hypothetical protein
MMNRFFPTLPHSAALMIVLLIGTGWLLNGCGGGGNNNGGDSVATANQIPTALITSPTGSYFNEGENIVFSGTGSDDEDGPLSGSALEWRSNIDGTIGSGSSIVTSALSAGIHEITLTAKDSEGEIYTTPPVMITNERTRFIKMGFQTSGVPDASNAFDGDHDTAATLITANTEYIHFRAYIGSAETFAFAAKVGGSDPDSTLAFDGRNTSGNWMPITTIPADADKTESILLQDAQNYMGGDGYINLRVMWLNGQSPFIAPIFELWRIDPVTEGKQTIGVANAGLAFDADETSYATITEPWISGVGESFLHFQVYFGSDGADTFHFKLLHNSIGSDQFIVIDVEDLSTPAPADWKFVQTLTMDSIDPKIVSVPNAQDYIDTNGYISLRARWVNLSPNPPLNDLNLYTIERKNPFYIGPYTPSIYVNSPANAVDRDDLSFATIYYFWGESDGASDRYDFLHLKSYAGDDSNFSLTVRASASVVGAGADMIIEGEIGPDQWSLIKRIGLTDAPAETVIELRNARPYVSADAMLSLRIRWESNSLLNDTHIYEVSPLASQDR